MTELVACEFEDSTNCFWNAQEQGNGAGESFVDIDGTAYYIEDAGEIIALECPPNKVPGWLDENGQPQGCVDNNPTPGVPKEDLPVVGEETVTQTEVPTQAPDELAVTGEVDVFSASLLGIVLVVAGVVLYFKGKNKTQEA